MTSKKPAARGKEKGKATSSKRNVVPDIYQEMLADALPRQSDIVERPLKKRRTGRRYDHVLVSGAKVSTVPDHVDDEEDLEFEDVLGPAKDEASHDAYLFAEDDGLPKKQQTAYRDSDDESDEDDLDWEAIDFESKTPVEPSGDLELTLSTRAMLPQRRTTTPRRKAVTKEERGLRLQIHKMHVLCLLSYVDRRNNWCNDYEVQKLLKPLLNKKMLQYLSPSASLSQFGQAESLKRGLEDVARMWRTKFGITMRGIRRALWADNEEDLRNVR
jgi:xeroderma pigmentosum group C-complementing protein